MNASVEKLKLTSVEKYFYLNESKNCPLSLGFSLRLRGPLVRQRLESAFNSMLVLNPLLCSRIVRSKFGHYYWQPLALGDRPNILWFEYAPNEQANYEYIDLSVEAGLVVKAFVHNDVCWVILQFHHACADGLGAMQFTRDVFGAYDDHTTARFNEGIAMDALKRRGRLGMGRLDWLKLWAKHRFNYGLIKKYYTNKPVSLVSRHSGRQLSESRNNFGLVNAQLSDEQIKQLQRQARQYGLNLNDWLVSHLLIAVKNWRQTDARPTDIEKEVLRIGIPINMRSRATVNTPSCNIASTLFLGYCNGQITNDGDFHENVRQQIHFRKTKKTALDLMLIFSLIDIIPGLLAKLTQNNQHHTTIFLTNVGKMLRGLRRENTNIATGNCIIEECQAIPPLWSNVQSVIAVSQFGNKLSFCLRYDTASMTAKQANDLLQCYLETLGLPNITTSQGFL
jgi:NRPS condensation-like uncharacterized protein